MGFTEHHEPENDGCPRGHNPERSNRIMNPTNLVHPEGPQVPPPHAVEATVVVTPEAAINNAWQKCVDALTEDAISRLAAWRGYSVDHCRILRDHRLIGLHDDTRIAFPLSDSKGDVIGMHHRPLARNGEWLVTWFKHRGTFLPLAVNDPLTKPVVAAFESQWDLFACMEMLGWGNGGPDAIGFVATRGAANGRRVKDYCRADSLILAFTQNDGAGKSWQERVVKSARSEVRAVTIPAQFKDLNEWTKSGISPRDVGAAIEVAEVLKEALPASVSATGDDSDAADDPESAYDGNKPLETTRDGRIWVLLPRENRLLSEFASDLGRALSETELFSRSDLPVVVDHLNSNLKLLSPDSFRTWAELYTVCYNIEQPKEGPPFRERKTMSATDANAVLAAQQFLKRLRQIRKLNQITLPVQRESGLIELLPVGYDAESMTYTFGSVGPDFPRPMSRQQARTVVDELFGEFCFPPDGGRSLAISVAAAMTLFAYGIMPKGALAPCFFALANAEGAGKTQLMKTIIIPVFGRFVTGVKPSNEEEMRKMLLASVMEGSPALVLDNVKEHVDSGSLEAFLTTDMWSDRILGSSKKFNGEKHIVVFATGNACSVSPDMSRRSLFIQLFMRQERAEERRFRTSLDATYLLARRNDILSALMAMVRDWDMSGRPVGTAPYSSFPEWRRTIAAIVEHAGYRSPVEQSEANRAADRDGSDMRVLVKALPPETRMNIFTFKELVAFAREAGAFESLIGTEGDLDKKIITTFARVIKRYSGRYIGDFVFESMGQGHDRRYVFRKENEETAMPRDLQD